MSNIYPLDNPRMELYFSSPVIQGAYDNYKSLLEKYRNRAELPVLKINDLNNQVLELLSQLPESLSYLYISITSSDSLFYRFSKKDEKCEYKLEVFFNLEDEESEVQSTLNVYENGVNSHSYYGLVIDIFDIIKVAKHHTKSEMYFYEVKKTPVPVKQYFEKLAVPVPINS